MRFVIVYQCSRYFELNILTLLGYYYESRSTDICSLKLELYSVRKSLFRVIIGVGKNKTKFPETSLILAAGNIIWALIRTDSFMTFNFNGLHKNNQQILPGWSAHNE